MLALLLVAWMALLVQGREVPPGLRAKRGLPIVPNPSCPETTTVCQTPENCGPGGVTGCGCDCPGCPSCVQATNPHFNRPCDLNLVLLIDESASIDAYGARSDVVNAALAFMTVLANIKGNASVAVVEFNDQASFILDDWDASPLPFHPAAAYLPELEAYFAAPPGGPGDPYSYDPAYGCTNWEEALQIVYSIPYCQLQYDGSCPTTICIGQNGTDDPLCGVPVRPDIVIFFTDGAPTIHSNGQCDLNCNADRERVASSGLIGPGNGGDVGSACFWSDKIKNNGTKIFMVGVGPDAPLNEANFQLISGPNQWNSNPDSFNSADYVLNPSYDSLIGILFGVASALCHCQQEQPPCVPPPISTGFNCAGQYQFDARYRVSAGPNSTLFPSNSEYFGYMYYAFANAQPTSVWAINVQAQDANATTVGDIVTTDLFNPCSYNRKVTCAIGCYVAAHRGVIPRFFLEGTDELVTKALDGPTSSCSTTVYHKPPPFSFFQADAVQYLWVAGSSICAARAYDGTLWEFFATNDVTVPGVNYRYPWTWNPQDVTNAGPSGPVGEPPYDQPFNFATYENCTEPAQCSGAVDVAYVVGSNLKESSYLLVQSYVDGLISNFNEGSGTQAGIVLNNQPLLTQLTQNLVALQQIFGTTPYLPNAATNYYTVVSNAIETFWPNVFQPGVDQPRYLLTLVTGPDANGAWSDAQRASFQALKKSRGVESWVVALDTPGSGVSLETVTDLADTINNNPNAAYDHYVVLTSALLLAGQQQQQAAQMCPTTTPCGPTCQGLCVCGVCECPRCITADPANKCIDVCCDETTKKCTVADKATQIAPYGCWDPTVTYDPGQKLVCEPTTGECSVDDTCKGKSGCSASQLNPCVYNDVNLTDCSQCTIKPKTCACGDACGATCDPNTGTCTGANVTCDDGCACTIDTCYGADPAVYAGGYRCAHVDVGNKLCPSTGNPCILPFCVCNETQAQALNVTLTPGTPCVGVPLPALIDLCGVCLGNNSCYFAVPPGVDVGAIVGGTIGAVAAAAAAALLAAWARNRGGAGVAPSNAGGAVAAQTSPVYKADGLAGDMPAI